jgi:hypothetical protein
VVPSMANRWSHTHRKTSSEVVPFTWQPTPPTGMQRCENELSPAIRERGLPSQTRAAGSALCCAIWCGERMARG